MGVPITSIHVCVHTSTYTHRRMATGPHGDSVVPWSQKTELTSSLS